jgi:hypothetical protein
MKEIFTIAFWILSLSLSAQYLFNDEELLPVPEFTLPQKVQNLRMEVYFGDGGSEAFPKEVKRQVLYSVGELDDQSRLTTYISLKSNPINSYRFAYPDSSTVQITLYYQKYPAFEWVLKEGVLIRASKLYKEYIDQAWEFEYWNGTYVRGVKLDDSGAITGEELVFYDPSAHCRKYCYFERGSCKKIWLEILDRQGRLQKIRDIQEQALRSMAKTYQIDRDSLCEIPLSALVEFQHHSIQEFEFEFNEHDLMVRGYEFFPTYHYPVSLSYDSLNRVVEKTIRLPNGVETTTTTYRMDGNVNRVETHAHNYRQEDKLLFREIFAYDSLGRIEYNWITDYRNNINGGLYELEYRYISKEEKLDQE